MLTAGADSIFSITKINNQDEALPNGSKEKLHQNTHWQCHRMFVDLMPHFDDDEPIQEVRWSLNLHWSPH
jgi:hypothetical protein